ncbi:origin recognition complex subunit 4 [Anticarsia gemmatalis]|uniref:origin recognition complex subunit 4 n=1 Tax=Anticarsia gemmatalis TaxID=129554 RepID=UPI003F76238D
MCGLHTEDPLSVQIKIVRKYLKMKIMADNVTFRGHTQDRDHVYELFKRTVVSGESHSALMIGPRGSGKTTLINSVLHQISKEVDLSNDAIIVRLNGLIHHDDKIALKSITAQMQLENAVGDRVFGTFAENLAFLLSCLQSGADRRCKSMLFILEEFDMFCHSGRTQTLLYNLFDITHSQQAPMCVLGITNRIDVMELLEKRVKSRFSHRHIFMFPHEDHQAAPHVQYLQLLVQLLSMPATGGRKKRSRRSTVTQDDIDIDQASNSLPPQLHSRVDLQQLNAEFVEDWNCHVKSLTEDSKVIDALEKLCYYTVNEQIYRNVLFELVSKLSENQPFIDVADLQAIIDKTVAPNHRVKLIQSLSVLELSLLIAMKHGMEIFDGQPMNFEMVLHRYQKFANTNSSMQSVPRPVILKAFEHLQELELIVSATKHAYKAEDTCSRVQKEYKLYSLAAPLDDINESVLNNHSLPTDLTHWYNNSVD